MKYLLSGWSTMTSLLTLLLTSLYEVFIEWIGTTTSFTPLLIVTSLYEVFIEGMEYDDIFHTFSHCDLTV